MKPMHAPLATLVLALFLAACGFVPTPADATDGELATITLSAGSLTSSAALLAPQGVPTNDDGVSAVEYLEIRVFDMDTREIISFDEENTYDPDGTADHLIIGEDETSVTLRLPTGAYTFVTLGLDVEAGTILAAGLTSSTITVDTDTVSLDLNTLLGNVTLEPVAPLNYIVPGQTLDLYLNVQTPGDTPFTVPVSDYTATYDLPEGMGSIEGDSELGARITVTDDAPADNFSVSVTARGWVVTDGVVDTETDVTASYSLPFLQTTGVSVDRDAPTLTFDDPDTIVDGTSFTLSGTSDDGVGIDRVRIYEGPVLIASSASNEYGDEDVQQITFDGTNWSAEWTPESEGSYGLKAIAIDTSGNEAVVDVEADFPVAPF